MVLYTHGPKSSETYKESYKQKHMQFKTLEQNLPNRVGMAKLLLTFGVIEIKFVYGT